MNVVFDLGGVVVRWDPDNILKQVFQAEDTRRLVQREIFEHADWVELDRGSIAFDEAVDRGAERTGLPPAEVARLLDFVPQSLTPFEDTVAIIRSVRAAGHRVFALSNIHHSCIDYLEQEHTLDGLFDGMVVSCRIRMVKPEPGIYDYLLETHGLAAADTVFIDDMEVNVAAALSRGIRAIRFENVDQCRRALAELGALGLN